MAGGGSHVSLSMPGDFLPMRNAGAGGGRAPQIVLLRHGRPGIAMDRRLNPAEFGRWVAEYNAAGIDSACRPPPAAIEAAGRCALVVCSNLRRSLESAGALGGERVGVGDPLFREMEMPHADLPCPRLSAGAWSVLFRLLWAAGYSARAESFRAARERARACAERLAELAAAHGSVLLVGHGSLNWFIAKYLKEMGWSGPGQSPRRYWEFGVYRCFDTGRGIRPAKPGDAAG